MDTLFFIAIVIAAFIAFDLLAVRYGVDSRETLGDDHNRAPRF